MAEDFETLGCKHYKRKCALISPCCGKVYTCRLCHDDKEEDHELDRKAVKQVQCLSCKVKQKVKAQCSHCQTVFGQYFCELCRLYDDTDKKQFHCDGCGICRAGGREKYYHCDVCDLCLSIETKQNHKCIEKVSRANCPVCMEDLHTSRDLGPILPCSHLMHRECYKQMLSKGHFACPLCGESMVDIDWKQLDREIANTPMPEEYRETLVNGLCKDCHKVSRSKFHVLGQKCLHCGSYNTCGTGKEPDPLMDQPSKAGDAAAMTGAQADGGASAEAAGQQHNQEAQTVDSMTALEGTPVDNDVINPEQTQ